MSALPPLPHDLLLREALPRITHAFAKAGIGTAALDARVLAADALGLDAAGVLTRAERPLGFAGAAILADHVARRLGREPVARILGRREFWSLPFRLSPDTLVPRPETETVVETALAHRPEAARILDLGTGSGCLLIALLHERQGAWGLGLDRSLDALATARVNADANGVGDRAAFAAGSWADALAGRFDLVVSNPPYIPRGEIAGLDPEVARHDPPAALDGGPDGLDAYRAILATLPRLLAPGAVAVLEAGIGQAGAIVGIGIGHGLRVTALARDLSGIERAVVLEVKDR